MTQDMPSDLTTDPTSAGDWGQTDLDPQQRQEAEVNLEDPTATADVSWSPPERRPRGAIHLDEDGDRQEETIEERLSQQVPEEGSAYGAHEVAPELDQQPEEMVGGDDPDAIPARTDVVAGMAGGEDVPLAHGTAEESAMQVIEGEPDQVEPDFPRGSAPQAGLESED